MKRALVLQHTDHDHAGRFLDFFAEDGIIPEPVRLWEGEEIPNLAHYDLMFVLGGAQDTWQEKEYPWMAGEKLAIREWVWDRGKPYFGVCLGHQLLCDALGGEVALAEPGEVGVCDLELTEEGRSHRVFAGLGSSHKVLQFHLAQVTRAPQQAMVLAQSRATAVQAVAIDSHAVGTQFHCECSAQTLAGWVSTPGILSYLEKHIGPGAYRRLIAESYPLMPHMAAMTRRIYDNFVVASGLRK